MKSILSERTHHRRRVLVPALLIAVLLAAAGTLPAVAESPSAGSPPGSGDAATPSLLDLLVQLLGIADPSPAPPPTVERKDGPIGPLIDPNGQSPRPPGAAGGHGMHGAGNDGNRSF